MPDKKRRKYDLYFPHKAGARNDPKLLKVLAKHTHVGVSIYWSVVEILRESPDFSYPADALDELALQVYLPSKELQKIVETFIQVGLLKESDKRLFSPGLTENMAEMQAKSEKAKESIRKRWNKERNTDVSKANNDGNTKNGTTVIQGKERKGDSLLTERESLIVLLCKKLTAQPPAERLETLVSGWPCRSEAERKLVYSLYERVKTKALDSEFAQQVAEDIGTDLQVETFDKDLDLVDYLEGFVGA